MDESFVTKQLEQQKVTSGHCRVNVGINDVERAVVCDVA